MPRTPVDDLEVTTLGTRTLIRSIAPTEMSAYGEFYHNPQIMVRDGNTIVNGDDGVPIQFRDVTAAIRWCRS